MVNGRAWPFNWDWKTIRNVTEGKTSGELLFPIQCKVVRDLNGINDNILTTPCPPFITFCLLPSLLIENSPTLALSHGQRRFESLRPSFPQVMNIEPRFSVFPPPEAAHAKLFHMRSPCISPWFIAFLQNPCLFHSLLSVPSSPIRWASVSDVTLPPSATYRMAAFWLINIQKDTQTLC